MISHLFKLIWNQKRKNLGISAEILFAFMVLFFVFSFVLYNFYQYTKPLGFQYENVWQVNLDWKDTPSETVAAVQAQMDDLLKSQREIATFSFCSDNTPFSGTTNNTQVTREGNSIITDVFYVDDNFHQTLDIKMLEGRWFGREDDGASYQPVVISEAIRDRIFSNQPAVGQKLSDTADQPLQIVGVCDNYRYRGDFERQHYGYFVRQGKSRLPTRLLLQVGDQAGAAFESRLLSDLQQVAPGWSIEIQYLTDQRALQMKFRLIPMIIFGIVGGFLIFNVALGLFGVLWQSINKRRGEIGLRRAMGSTRGEITRQFISKVLILTTLSLLLGAFFAVQFPLLNVFNVPLSVYLAAMAGAALVIYLLVFLCAFFPSLQAAGLHPAVALHEE